MASWAVRSLATPTTAALTSVAIAFVSGVLLGVYSVRGYLIPLSLAEERRRNLTDPVESDASDVDDDTILDHAPNWANGAEADARDGLRQRAVQEKGTSNSSSKAKDGTTPLSPPGNEECKLVLVVRTDLGMTKGKIAAQCGHATLACYKSLRRGAERGGAGGAAASRLLQRWERGGQAKIALQAKGEDTLLTLMGTARSLGVTAEVIADAGRTQIDAGSLTVLGVGPAPKSLVDQVTGHLKLL
ncbi:mitochondrial peptidyl-tRNA hydrolase [Niveomyces insectorum RCEF 264]|uniref:peptidyl-tRNA hydrolase n=1 Tax=Niveomyces insectorum RCEF 264 TaxID=1081102 RepID=A0A167NU14_9HYPO|nr:mitochondrial peptidyl-tRNA hydrolase [Niveomyces insectorum RCEF 264]